MIAFHQSALADGVCDLGEHSDQSIEYASFRKKGEFMKIGQTKFACIVLSGLICCAFTNPALADEQPSVIIQSYGKHTGGNIVYTYQVTNRGPERLFAFDIGCNCQNGVPDDDRPELVFYPLNYDFNTGVPGTS